MSTDATTASAQDAAAEAPDAPTTREVTLDGETYIVPASFSDAEAQKAATALRDAKAGRANGTPSGSGVPDVERPATTEKPKRTTKTVSVPAGSLRIRLSKTAYEQAFAGKDGSAWRTANAATWKKMKGLTGKSVGSSIAYFPTLTLAEATEVVKHLRATAKQWTKAEKAAGSPAPLLRNATVIEGEVKAAK